MPTTFLPTTRRRSLAAFLWLSAFAWAIALGAKVFDLLVLGSAWGRSPPESFALLPYGRNYPIDPGDFFQPLSAILLIGLLGALIAGWRQKNVRKWLFVTAAALAVIWIFTPTVFWPLIGELWETARGRHVHSTLESEALVRRWFVLDTVRILFIALGFVSTIFAVSDRSRSEP